MISRRDLFEEGWSQMRAAKVEEWMRGDFACGSGNPLAVLYISCHYVDFSSRSITAVQSARSSCAVDGST